METSQRIFEIMLKKGLKQKELSDFTNIPTSTISTWKRKHVDPDVKYIPQIADFLGVSIEYLITGNDNTNCTDINSESRSTISNTGILINGDANQSKNSINSPEIKEPQDEVTQEMIKVFKSLSVKEKIKVLNMVYEMKGE